MVFAQWFVLLALSMALFDASVWLQLWFLPTTDRERRYAFIAAPALLVATAGFTFLAATQWSLPRISALYVDAPGIAIILLMLAVACGVFVSVLVTVFRTRRAGHWLGIHSRAAGAHIRRPTLPPPHLPAIPEWQPCAPGSA